MFFLAEVWVAPSGTVAHETAPLVWPDDASAYAYPTLEQCEAVAQRSREIVASYEAHGLHYAFGSNRYSEWRAARIETPKLLGMRVEYRCQTRPPFSRD